MKYSNVPELGPYFTFSPSKKLPVYNWFYYKEAFSPELVEFFLNKFNLKNGKIIDPFCGIGTTLLYAKSRGFDSYGTDASSLAYFVSKVKCDNYSEKDLVDSKSELKNLFSEIPKIHVSYKWDWELFDPLTIFPKSSINFIIKAKSLISRIENKKIQHLFLLALLSIIPQCSLLKKDGGVLKFDKRKGTIPAKHAFKRKVKRMIKDLENNSLSGPTPTIEIGDARKINLKDNSADAVITSPPYLNNIDYTKIYGLELTLLSGNPNLPKTIRKNSLRSFHSSFEIEKKVPKEVEEFGIKYPLIGAYFSDMEQVLKETHRILKPDSSAVFIVGNSIMYNTHILVDEILAEIGERIGFETEIITSLKRLASTPKSKVETRESAVVLKKK